MNEQYELTGLWQQYVEDSCVVLEHLERINEAAFNINLVEKTISIRVHKSLIILWVTESVERVKN